MSTFNEQDHPRQADGKFRDKPQQSSGVGLGVTRSKEEGAFAASLPDVERERFTRLMDHVAESESRDPYMWLIDSGARLRSSSPNDDAGYYDFAVAMQMNALEDITTRVDEALGRRRVSAIFMGDNPDGARAHVEVTSQPDGKDYALRRHLYAYSLTEDAKAADSEAAGAWRVANRIFEQVEYLDSEVERMQRPALTGNDVRALSQILDWSAEQKKIAWVEMPDDGGDFVERTGIVRGLHTGPDFREAARIGGGIDPRDAYLRVTLTTGMEYPVKMSDMMNMVQSHDAVEVRA